jgi:RimK family alpha-L-glutamate ligase
VPASESGAGLRVAVLGSTGAWHARRIEHALTDRGHTCDFAAVTRMAGRTDPAPGVRSREHELDAYDAVLVRGIPRGSLEQVIFRVDALHVLQAGGVRVLNGATAIERTVDKFLASAILARAGVPTPRTVACERAEDATAAFAELGGDVVVKPLFGSMGFGIARLEDPDVADRVFRALEIERAVYYLQETLAHDGRDLRAMVVGARVLGAMERTAAGFRTNLARGGTAHAATLTAEQEDLALRTARALDADYAGVDLLRTAEGRDYVVEVNGIPGWQGFERATGIDVAAAIVDHLEAHRGEATWAA